MRKSHKTQHWVPQSYLAAWVDPDTPPNHTPYVHAFSKDGNSVRRRAPANIFTENDLYTIKAPDGGRDLTLEHGLSQLEGAFNVMRRDFLARRRQLPPARHTKLLLFVAALHARTPFMRDHHGAFWNELLEKGEKLEARMRNASREERLRAVSVHAPQRDRDRSMSLDDVRRIAENPMQELLRPMIAAVAPLLCRLHGTVWCTDDDPGFITSDTPVIWYDPDWYKNPPLFRSPSFLCPKLEITMPISPSQLLVLTHGHFGLSYLNAPDLLVSEINRRNRSCCSEEFIVRRNLTNLYWFDPGVEPDDSWDKTHNADNMGS